MNFRKTTLSATVAALVSIGMAGQAYAYTSAGAKIEYRNLTISIFDVNTNQIQGNVDNFTFTASNDATITGNTNDSGTLSCQNAGAIPGPGTCGPAGSRLDPAQQTWGTSPPHAANNFNLDGPGPPIPTSYSLSDSAILTAQLAGDQFTDAGIIGETQLITTDDGQTNASISSTTGFIFSFVLPNAPGPYSLVLSFDANPEQYSESDNPESIEVSANTKLSMSAKLSQDFEADGTTAGDGKAEWAPDGQVIPIPNALNIPACSEEAGGVFCSNESDFESLNGTTTITTDGATDHFSPNEVFGLYSITFNNLDAGDWSFTIGSTLLTNAVKVKQVPEPVTLLLLGTGMLGLVAMRRRRKQA